MSAMGTDLSHAIAVSALQRNQQPPKNFSRAHEGSLPTLRRLVRGRCEALGEGIELSCRPSARNTE